ncbi:MAG: hypothetical protein FWG10_04335 [Eubacteriaceae bacterium]|nr:hypothetical protein [Eubacteriaceae bacterium]
MSNCETTWEKDAFGEKILAAQERIPYRGKQLCAQTESQWISELPAL